MRLIDANEALELFRANYANTGRLIKLGEIQLDSLAEGYTEAAHIIKHILPSVDAVPVVRCKACANFRQNAHGVCWCDEYGGSVTPDDYCSRAVTDEQTRAKVPWEAD